jgi:hypothetical protein
LRGPPTAAGIAAQSEGIACIAASRRQLLERATATMRTARESLQCLMRDGLIGPLGG